MEAISFCVVCRKTGTGLACGGCNSVNYCGRDCQLIHWKSTHKQACPRLARVRDVRPRLTAKRPYELAKRTATPSLIEATRADLQHWAALVTKDKPVLKKLWQQLRKDPNGKLALGHFYEITTLAGKALDTLHLRADLLMHARLALAAGMDVNRQHPTEATLPLFVAMQIHDVDLVQLLLNLGADVRQKLRVDAMSACGPVHFAVHYAPSPAILRLLLEYGGDPDERDCDGNKEKYTPLQHVITGTFIDSFGEDAALECVRALIAAGADLDWADATFGDVHGDTTLKLISRRLTLGDVECRTKHERTFVAAARILLAAGADPDARSQVPCVGLPAPRVLDDVIEGHYCNVCSFDPILPWWKPWWKLAPTSSRVPARTHRA